MKQISQGVCGVSYLTDHLSVLNDKSLIGLCIDLTQGIKKGFLNISCICYHLPHITCSSCTECVEINYIKWFIRNTGC